MYRRGKPFHRCATLFPYSFIIYVVLMTLLLATWANEAWASPSQRDIKEAEKIVGRFLRNEAGTTWLSGLAKTRSAPLTTQDLMNEMLEATRPGGEVWKAASILSESLKEQAQKGIMTDPIMSKPENWKDIIADIENQDDIICLYRKNTEETAKKADDWKKFLRTVSPGYTVHLAIDTGHKYVICLKKIEVPETTSEEIVTTPSTEVTSVDPSVETAQMTLLQTNSTKINVQSDDSDEDCDDKDLENTDDIKIEDINTDDTVNGNIRNKYSSDDKYNINKKRGMEDILTDKFGDNSIDSQHDWRRISESPSVKQKEFYMKNNGWPLVGSPVRMQGEIGTMSSQDPGCSRPIILVVHNGNTPLKYRQGQAFGIPIRQNLKSSLFSKNHLPNPTMHRPFMSPPISQYAVLPHKLPRALNNPLMLTNNFQQLARVNNMGKPIASLKTTRQKARPRPIFSQNTNLVYNIPRGQMRKPRVQAIPQSIMQTKKKTFVPSSLDIKSRGSPSVKQKPDDVNNLRYPLNYYIPRRGAVSADSNLSQTPETTEWKVPTRKTLLPKRKIPKVVDPLFPSKTAKNAYRFRQYLQKNRDSQFPPWMSVFESTTQPIVQRQVLHNSEQSLRPPFPTLPSRNLYQIPSKTNSFLRPNVLSPTRYGLRASIRPCTSQWNALYAMAENSQSAMNSLLANPLVKCSNPLVCPRSGYQISNQLAPCPSPCDRPLKLQIMINGNIQEPSEVTIISEPGQRVEIVGSGVPIMPYGSRALREGNFSVSDLGDKVENILWKESNERKKINGSDEAVDVDEKNEENEEENQDENSSSRTTSDRNEKLNDNNSTTEVQERTTNDGPQDSGSDGPDIEERFLHETTIITSTINSTTGENTTMSAITNSTVVE